MVKTGCGTIQVLYYCGPDEWTLLRRRWLLMTTKQISFGDQYGALQDKWRQLTIDHGHNYLPYLAPQGPVDFVLVGKIPSISEKAAAEVPAGEYPATSPPHLNLLLSIGDLILHYSAHRYLCRDGESYYLTDLGKCALPPKRARGKIQQSEFGYWYPIFLTELDLVAKPNATVIPVGAATGNFLKGQSNFPYRLTKPILHWSRAAVVAAKMASSLFPQEWENFRTSTNWYDLHVGTKDIFLEARLGQHVDGIHHRFKDKFKDIHRHYMFTYKREMPLRRPDVGEK